jgi:hypothetical protein
METQNVSNVTDAVNSTVSNGSSVGVVEYFTNSAYNLRNFMYYVGEQVYPENPQLFMVATLVFIGALFWNKIQKYPVILYGIGALILLLLLL